MAVVLAYDAAHAVAVIVDDEIADDWYASLSAIDSGDPQSQWSQLYPDDVVELDEWPMVVAQVVGDVDDAQVGSWIPDDELEDDPTNWISALGAGSSDDIDSPSAWAGYEDEVTADDWWPSMLAGVADEPLTVDQVTVAGGYGSGRRKWRVQIGNKVLMLTQAEIAHYKAVIEAEDVQSIARAQPMAKADRIARSAVRIIERPADVGRVENRAFTQFLARLREDYASAVRTQLIAQIIQENDDEEALILLL